ncbi:MAG: PEGA domain-containing protein [Myxococcaceae bacterium]
MRASFANVYPIRPEVRVASRLVAPLLLGLFAGGAFAQGKPPLMVLQLDQKGVTALQGEAATQLVARGIRELDVFSVLSSEDVRQLLAIERSKQLMTGGSQGLSSLGAALGATHAVVGSMTKLGAGAMEVELRLLDTVSSKVVSQRTTGQVAGMEKLVQLLPNLAQELVGPLLADQQGDLLVRAREEGSEVLVDGTLVGSTPMTKAVRVPRGNHRLQVRKEGFIAQTRTARIEPGQMTLEEVTLMPSPDYAAAYQAKNSKQRLGAILATAGAVLALGGAIAMDRLWTEPLFQNEFLPRQIWLQEHAGVRTDQTSRPEIDNNPAALAVYQSCVGDEAGCRDRAQALETQLRIQQISTIALGVVGVGVAGWAAYMWASGDDPNRYANLVASASISGDGAGMTLAGRW